MRIPQTITIGRALASAARCTHRGGTTPKKRREAVVLIEADSLVAPAFSYRVYEIRNIENDWLDLGCCKLKSAVLANASPALARVAVIACTLGPALETAVSGLTAAKRYSRAFALDEVGNDVLFYTNRYASLAVRAEIARLDESTRYFISPGGREIGLDQQRVLLDMAGGGGLGITVSEGCMLWPVKSHTMVIGIGKSDAGSQHTFRKRCATCSSHHVCRYCST